METVQYVSVGEACIKMRVVFESTVRSLFPFPNKFRIRSSSPFHSCGFEILYCEYYVKKFVRFASILVSSIYNEYVRDFKSSNKIGYRFN